MLRATRRTQSSKDKCLLLRLEPRKYRIIPELLVASKSQEALKSKIGATSNDMETNLKELLIDLTSLSYVGRAAPTHDRIPSFKNLPATLKKN